MLEFAYFFFQITTRRVINQKVRQIFNDFDNSRTFPFTRPRNYDNLVKVCLCVLIAPPAWRPSVDGARAEEKVISPENEKIKLLCLLLSNPQSVCLSPSLAQYSKSG